MANIDQLCSISEEALENLVYIVGHPRGGTKFIQNAIGIHDDVLMLPNITHFMNLVWRYRKKVDQRAFTTLFGSLILFVLLGI